MKRISILLFSLLIFAPFKTSAYSPIDNDLVKSKDSNSVYYIKNGGRYSFPFIKTYQAYFGDDFSRTKILTSNELALLQLKGNILLPDNSLVKITSLPKVYKVITQDGIKSLEWIASEQDAINLFGINWASTIIDVPDVFFMDYQIPSGSISIDTPQLAKNYPVPSYPVPSYPVPSYPVPSYPVTSIPAPSIPVTSSTNTTALTCSANTTVYNNQCISYDTICKNKYGQNSDYSGVIENNKFICGCLDGYKFNLDNTSCISYDESCKLTYGSNYYSSGTDFVSGRNICSPVPISSIQPNQSLSLICNERWERYKLLSTNVAYSDPVYFSERSNLSDFINKYCGISIISPTSNVTSQYSYLPIYNKIGGSCNTDSIGYTRCTYSDGSSMTSSTDSIGYTRLNYSNGGSGSCSTDSIGTTRCTYSDGSSMTSSTDSIGYTRLNYSNGESGSCSTNSIGTTRCTYSNGSSISCSTDSLGETSCN